MARFSDSFTTKVTKVHKGRPGSSDPSCSFVSLVVRGFSVRHKEPEPLPQIRTRRFARRRYLVAATAAIACTVLAQAPGRIQFRLQSREVVESHLKSFSTKNATREVLTKNWLGEAGCKDADLSEQALDRKLPPNVICVLPGETQEVILVGAHTDHVDTFGDGVVDNWTGAVLLPALAYALSGQPRHHTLIFIGFSAEEKGLLGSQYYADHLTGEQRAHIAAMVNMDSLGTGPTEVWASHADKKLLDALVTVGQVTKLPVSGMNVDNLGTADSESFARYQIPRITFHSITQTTWALLHSPNDKMAAIKWNDYYDSYRLLASYLAFLDRSLTTSLKSEPAHTTH